MKAKAIKRRTPRTTGNHLDFDGSHMFGWPYDWNTPAAKKLYKRFRAGLCLGCGNEKKDCRCKSKMLDPVPYGRPYD